MTSFEWQVPFLVLVIVATIVYASDRRRRKRGRPAPGPTNGADLIQRLQDTLGMAIVIESIESPGSIGSEEMAEPNVAVPQDTPDSAHTIRATLMFGRYTARVLAMGATESDAWADLARMAIAWRNADYQHIPMWGGGA
jgi:hypothetical protein